MSTETPVSDADLLDLLRVGGQMGIRELTKELKVTPTAVRQRLMRTMAQKLVEREAVHIGRGRPKHLYRLTEKGVRLTGSNFTDLALALWREMGTLENDEVRIEMVSRIAKALAETYADQIQGETTVERMRSLSELLAQRRIPISVKDLAQELVMTAHACPYPRLAEQDRAICTMEKMLYSTLLGHDIQLTQCRLDGEPDCQFQVG